MHTHKHTKEHQSKNKLLRTGSCSHLSRTAVGIDKCPASFIWQSLSWGALGCCLSLKSAVAWNFGCIWPTWPLPCFHYYREIQHYVNNKQTNICFCLAISSQHFKSHVLQELVFHPCQRIVKDVGMLGFRECCHIALCLEIVHQIHQHLCRETKT